ncbi:zincin [Aureobasidium sp. EXF-12298]|nr:zincin [Aureobasidium sp. EXF-12298]KAI4754218.1 zincin [Aureobasidium sp. EXF-12344]KAI4775293.1 zincin [Aureobasidium sp. EXF-3400]
MHTQTFISAALAVTAAASPVIRNREVTTVTVSGTAATSYPQPAIEIQGFPIHSSCNGTERRQLEKALGDTIKIAQQAAQHIYTHGNESTLYTKYFGQAPTAGVIGWYEKLIHGDHDGILFRCDDIDGNCHQEDWGGHWRGENATDETVICPLSYSTRQPLEALCANGYTVANGKLATYFAADLMHRLYHTTKIGEGAAEHYADTYTECLELAQENSAEAVRNTHTLQYFALDVYAMEVALPGEGCTGTPAEESDDSHAAASASSASAATSSGVTSAAATTAVSTTASQSASKTTSAGTECHTHAGGEVHCADVAPAETASKTTSAGIECHTHADGVVHCA